MPFFEAGGPASAAHAESITLAVFHPPAPAGAGTEGLAEAVAGIGFAKTTPRLPG